jgi:hypothetical protein
MSVSNETLEVNNELIVYNNFEDVKKEVANKYVNLLKNILQHIKNAEIGDEKHLKYYEQNMNYFINNNNEESVFKYFVCKFLCVMPEVVDKNVDFFLTEKPYILKNKHKTENNNATYLFKGNMLRYVLSSLRNPPKNNKIDRNEEINLIFDELLDIYRVFEENNKQSHNFLSDLQNYVDKHYKKSNKYMIYNDILNNYNNILNGYVKAEEISSEEEDKDEDKEENDDGGNLFSNMLNGASFLKDSSIFKIATELEKELKGDLDENSMAGLNDPKKVMESMSGLLSGNKDDNNNISGTIGKVLNKLTEKFNDGSFKKEDLEKDVSNLLKNFGGLSKMFGGNLFGSK